MANEELNNRIVTIEKIIELAEYFEKQRAHYKKVYTYNKKLNYYTKDDVNVYKGISNEINYKIGLNSGESLEKEDFVWFKQQLAENKTKNIKEISINFYTTSNSNLKGKSELSYSYVRKDINVYIYFYEDSVRYSVNGENCDEEVYQIRNDLESVFNGCPIRYDKTIKRKFLRDEALSLSIGFLIGYLTIICGFIFKDSLPSSFIDLMRNNKYSYIILFYIIAIGVGNIIGKLLSIGIYKKIAPRQKYSHYSKSSHQSVYTNDIEQYVKYNEVQIGKNYDTIRIRKKIEKIFNITGLIVLVHVVVTAIVCVML